MNVRIFLAAGALVFAAPAQAQTSNLWRVNGSISGRTFVLDCRLDQGAGLCTDASKGGKSHPLTSLAVTGNQARWSFKTRVAFIFGDARVRWAHPRRPDERRDERGRAQRRLHRRPPLGAAA